MADEENPFRKQPNFRKVILFNGPPGVGKDTAANYVRSFVQINAQWWHPRHMKLSEPLKKAAHALYDSFHSWDYYDTREGRAQKDMPCGDFLGRSPRQAYIDQHKQVLDALHGPEALGHIFKKRMIRENITQLFVLSDGGFVDELRPIVELIGQRNLMIIELSGVGFNFENDSRAYIGDAAKKEWPLIQVRKLVNPFGDKPMFKLICEGLAKNFLKIEEKE